MLCVGGSQNPFQHTPPLLLEQRLCQSNNRYCSRNFWNHVLLCPLGIRPPLVRALVGVVSVKFQGFSVALARGGVGSVGGCEMSSMLCAWVRTPPVIPHPLPPPPPPVVGTVTWPKKHRKH